MDIEVQRRRRATFTFYVGLPDALGVDEMEVVITKLIEFMNSGGLSVLNATWSCPELGRKRVPSGPVLAFNRESVDALPRR